MRLLSVPSVEATNTESPQTIGVEPLGPDIGAVQITFSVLLKLAGRFFSGLDPLKLGPRQFAQFSACRGSAASMMPESAPAKPNGAPSKFFRLTAHCEFN